DALTLAASVGAVRDLWQITCRLGHSTRTCFRLKHVICCRQESIRRRRAAGSNMTTLATNLPLMQSGDRMTRDEFLRCWEAMPHVKFAELIGLMEADSPQLASTRRQRLRGPHAARRRDLSFRGLSGSLAGRQRAA